MGLVQNNGIIANTERELNHQVVHNRREMEMNKKIVGIASVCVTVIALVMTVGINTNVIKPEETYTPGLVPPPQPILNMIEGLSVTSSQEASTVAGYQVKSPEYLPADYQVRAINADDKTATVTILASKLPVTSQTTDQDFIWKERGIVIRIQQQAADFDKDGHISKLAGFDPFKQVTINGMKGAAHEIITGELDGQPVHAPAELVFFKDDALVMLRAMLPVEDLIKIAETL